MLPGRKPASSAPSRRRSPRRQDMEELDMTDQETLMRQLEQGNKGAQGYFIKRVDIMLAAMAPLDGSAPLQPNLDLAAFMQRCWPAFRKGIRVVYGPSGP